MSSRDPVPKVGDIITLKAGTRRYRVTALLRDKANRVNGILATPCKQRFFVLDEIRICISPAEKPKEILVPENGVLQLAGDFERMSRER